MTTIKKWNECQIQHLPTDVLMQLRAEFTDELHRRRHTEKIQSVRVAHKKSKLPDMVDRGLLEKVNSAAMLSIPVAGKPSMRLPYLRPLINQDWSAMFSGDLDPDPKYYVYAHVSPDGPRFSASPEFGGNWGGQPFYIGKGCGVRAYDLKRNQTHGKLIAKAIEAGFESQDIVKIVKDGLTEAQALELEAKYIYFFGAAYEGKTGTLFNLDRSMIPEFVGPMTKFTKLERQNKHWISQWKRDHAEVLGKLGATT